MILLISKLLTSKGIFKSIALAIDFAYDLQRISFKYIFFWL